MTRAQRHEQILRALGDLHSECFIWAAVNEIAQRIPDLARKTVHQYLLELEKAGMVEKRYGHVRYGNQQEAIFRRV